MNVKRGVRRIATILLLLWAVAFFWFYGSNLSLLFLPAGNLGDRCNDRLADRGWAIYCNVLADGDYVLFTKAMFEIVSTQIAVFIGVPLLVLAIYHVSRWVVRGFKSA